MPPPNTLGLVALSLHHVSLDQNRGAQTVKNRAKKRTCNESSTTNATTKTNKGPKVRKQIAITATTPPFKLGYISPGTPGPLPSVYGTILSGGRI